MCPHDEVQASSAFFFLQEYHRRDSASFSLPPVEWYAISISPQLVPATLTPWWRWCLPAFCAVMLLSLFIINVCLNSFIYLCHHGVMVYYLSQWVIIHSYHYLFWPSTCSTFGRWEPRQAPQTCLIVLWEISDSLEWDALDPPRTFPAPGISRFSKEFCSPPASMLLSEAGSETISWEWEQGSLCWRFKQRGGPVYLSSERKGLCWLCCLSNRELIYASYICHEWC